MSRTVDQILRQQLGNLLVEIAVLTARNEELEEKLKQQQIEEPKELK